MNVLITGGTGFIGCRLALNLLRRGDAVKILGQENNSVEKENSDRLRTEGATVEVGSITDKNLIENLTGGIDVVFHLAAAQHEANLPDKHFHEVNVEGTRILVESCIQDQVKRFIHGSTIGVYGTVDGVIDEDTRLSPENVYEVSKLEAEKVVEAYSDRIFTSIIRIPETYGPGDRRLLKMFKSVSKGMFPLIGNGRNLHGLIYIDDLIDGLNRAASAEYKSGEIFLFAGDKSVTTREMIDTIGKVFDRNGTKLHLPYTPIYMTAVLMEMTLKPLGIQPPLHRRRMDFYRKSFELSGEKAKKVINFEPKTDFAEGVEKTVAWYRDNGLLS
jgi:nucleoside-diphosphate-sugar epimerase